MIKQVVYSLCWCWWKVYKIFLPKPSFHPRFMPENRKDWRKYFRKYPVLYLGRVRSLDADQDPPWDEIWVWVEDGSISLYRIGSNDREKYRELYLSDTQSKVNARLTDPKMEVAFRKVFDNPYVYRRVMRGQYYGNHAREKVNAALYA